MKYEIVLGKGAGSFEFGEYIFVRINRMHESSWTDSAKTEDFWSYRECPHVKEVA